eukprot:scaffold7946_cov267-Pinguiococcus_pyrenoidosus.AAC.1
MQRENWRDVRDRVVSTARPLITSGLKLWVPVRGRLPSVRSLVSAAAFVLLTFAMPWTVDAHGYVRLDTTGEQAALGGFRRDHLVCHPGHDRSSSSYATGQGKGQWRFPAGRARVDRQSVDPLESWAGARGVPDAPASSPQGHRCVDKRRVPWSRSRVKANQSRA